MDALNYLQQNHINAPFLVVGLGNPGREYSKNRHNIGFMAIDYISKEFGLLSKKVQSKAIILSGMYENSRFILAKPQTFMNLSGQSVASLIKFYKIPLNQLMIIHDDLDLPLGTIRIRPDGGAGGQKGLQSIIQQLGTNQFARIRLGIGRPPGQMDPANYVLQDFTAEEKEIVIQILDRVEKAVKIWMTDGIVSAMNMTNGSLLKD
mgnify:CR=1 FL=1